MRNSFGAIYERNAINAAFPVITCKDLTGLDLKNGDRIKVNLMTGKVENLQNKKIVTAEPFSDVQFEVFQKGGLLGK